MHHVQKRIEWIDLAKFVSIFAMVWGHSGVNESVDIFIHAFHMPIFFFLSGYLFKGRIDIGEKVYKLLVPYFVFGVGLFLIWKFLGCFVPIPNYKVSYFLEGILWNNAMKSPYACVQWFLTCLFLTEIFFWVIYQHVRKDSVLVLFIIGIAILGVAYPQITEVRLFWSMDCAFTGIVFYASGYLVRKYKEIISMWLTSKLVKILVVVFVIFVSIISTYSNGYVNMRTMQYGNILLYYISAFSIILLICLLSVCISKSVIIKRTIVYRVALYIGQNTLIVLVMNQVYNQILNWWIKKKILLMPHANKDIVDFASAVLVCILMIPTIYLLNRFLPFSVGRTIKEEKINE